MLTGSHESVDKLSLSLCCGLTGSKDKINRVKFGNNKEQRGGKSSFPIFSVKACTIKARAAVALCSLMQKMFILFHSYIQT